jgi:hypothetical protein
LIYGLDLWSDDGESDKIVASEAAVLVFRDVLDFRFQVFESSLPVGEIIGHIQGVADPQVFENIRLLADEDAQALGGNIPELELIEGGESFRGELDAVVPGISRTGFGPSFRDIVAQMICFHSVPRLPLGVMIQNEISYNQADINVNEANPGSSLIAITWDQRDTQPLV